MGLAHCSTSRRRSSSFFDARGLRAPGATTMVNMVVGIIGMGDMGKMYARKISTAGWR